MKKKVCILVRNNVERDPRILKQIRWLLDTKDYDITVIGFQEGQYRVPEVKRSILFEYKPWSLLEKIYTVPQLLLCNINSNHVAGAYWSSPIAKLMLDACVEEEFDIIHANDWDTLPIAVAAAKKTKKTRIIYDAHEFAPLEYEESFKFNLLFRKYRQAIESKYIGEVDAVVTVSSLIAEKITQIYNVESNVIMNCPDWQNASERMTVSDKIEICHHGIYYKTRGIEEIIKCTGILGDRYSLHFRLLGDDNLLNPLRKLAEETVPNRVFFHKPVKTTDIVKTISNHDIGIYALNPVNFNNKAALPNKFFEFIMAGLCLCIGPSPEMANLTHRFNCGIVAEGFSADQLAESIRTLDINAIQRYKENSIKAAEQLNSQVEGAKMMKIYEKLLS